MTFEEFNKKCTDAVKNKPSFMRRGQTIFNLLTRTWPMESDRIIDAGDKKQSPLNCFGNDDNIDNLMRHLELSWNKYPN
jgi:hypothetical protein